MSGTVAMPLVKRDMVTPVAVRHVMRSGDRWSQAKRYRNAVKVVRPECLLFRQA